VDGNIEKQFEKLSNNFEQWDKLREVIDQLIDIILNYRQSGHPGGSRSKVYMLLATMFSGVMRWDIRHPEKRFGDRFILGAGHTIPLLYCTLAALNEAMRVKYEQSGDERYAIPAADERALYWEDLLSFRRRGGLSGHAEMEGKTLFLKFNTGPSGHGSPAAVGAALALKRAGAEGVKVFIIEGEGGLTPGSTHETANSAWGLALDNLYYIAIRSAMSSTVLQLTGLVRMAGEYPALKRETIGRKSRVRFLRWLMAITRIEHRA
jgi:transketolase